MSISDDSGPGPPTRASAEHPLDVGPGAPARWRLRVLEPLCLSLFVAAFSLLLGADPLRAFGVGLAAGAAACLLLAAGARRMECDARLALRSGRAEIRRDSDARLLALELAYDRVRSVLESLGEGVIVVDEVGEVVLTNPASSVALRCEIPSLDPPLLEDVLAEEMREPARRALAALRSGEGGEKPRVYRVSSVSCGDRVFDLTAVPVESPRSGQRFGTVLLLVDVTRMHEVGRLKDKFLSSISHELRTPLTNICAYAEILRLMMPGEDAEWPEFVRVIHEEGLHLSSIVDSVFDFLMLENGDAVFHEERILPAITVRHVVTEESHHALAAGVRLESRIDSDCPEILADTGRFAQVCRNLIDNAIKFTPEGGLVRVTAKASGDHICLRVDDSGPGVPEEHRQSVFQKFYQVQNHLTEKPPGPGLGLATCQVIVQHFGGAIWCEESELGGAAFIVRLPAAKAEQPVLPDACESRA
ncbi:MAG: hypothetical protein Fur0037_14300 [Planctomycetota bacterium]